MLEKNATLEFCKRKHTDDELVTFVKGGGEAFNSLSRLFTSSNDDNV